MYEIPRASHSIQFYYKPKEPQSLDFLVGVTEGKDFKKWLTPKDIAIMEEEWPEVLKVNTHAVSQVRGLLCMHDTSEVARGKITYIFTDFETYVAASRTSERGMPMSPLVYNAMRVGAVGGVVYSLDDFVLVHKRPANATHVANQRDASVAGLAKRTAEGKVLFAPVFQEKLKRELGLTQEETEKVLANTDGYSIKLTAVHSSADPDCSGMVDAIIRIPQEMGKIVERANEKYLQDIHAVPVQNLVAYSVMHYLGWQPIPPEERLIPDGFAVLAASLPQETFERVVQSVNIYIKARNGRNEVAISAKSAMIMITRNAF